jgi:hypothetical protein
MIFKFNLVYLHLKEKLLLETLNQVSILLNNNLKWLMMVSFSHLKDKKKYSYSKHMD